MTTGGSDNDPAAARFAVISLARLAGALGVLLGLPMVAGNLPPSPALGIVLVIAGMMGFFFLPKLLARRWRSPPE